MGIYDYTIYDMLSRSAISFRKNPAWFEAETDETFTFAQLKKMVDRLAAGLQKNGIKKGLRIYRKPLILLVGAPRFELGTSCSQSRRATRLRYAPIGVR